MTSQQFKPYRPGRMYYDMNRIVVSPEIAAHMKKTVKTGDVMWVDDNVKSLNVDGLYVFPSDSQFVELMHVKILKRGIKLSCDDRRIKPAVLPHGSKAAVAFGRVVLVGTWHLL